MNLPIPLPTAKIIGVISLVFVAFSAGWMINGWRLQIVIVENQLSHAEAEVRAANTAIGELKQATETIANAATEYNRITDDTSSKINLLRREVRQYVQTHPLPADCKPDTYRVRKLSAGIEAANQAISGR